MITLTLSDALLITDIQNDFLPGGALDISGGDHILPALQNYMQLFERRRCTVVLTYDWHPFDHCSFKSQGGSWPVHCVAGSLGAMPPPSFGIPPEALTIYKAFNKYQDSGSAFPDTSLNYYLQILTVRRLFIGGLATDYSVLHSVREARQLGYEVCLLMDGIKAMNCQPDDGQRAEKEMIGLGAMPVRWEMVHT